VLTTTEQVPVGGAVAAGAVIVTQPQAGTYEAFDSACPHRGCAVIVQDALLVCPCHDSRFSLTGTLEQGPANRDLTSVPITVDGTDIVQS
ncbi:MAG: Rieske (2Fe-2S) protein, partial [Gordonia sp. (in: high G+C Gram-positive bacteria)]|uniref:Rieske (2Fe-2S) protein n=1 Tax=Gordonia sp. (in: high G+C Gram-positive bacteria) TaxID=84139 RepID=UPI003BB5F72B